MAISKRLRYEVMRRDQFKCGYCKTSDSPLTIDHVVPEALGGGDDPSNLISACAACNGGKSATSPDQATVSRVNEDAVRWASAIRMAAEQSGADRDAARARQDQFRREWIAYVDSAGRADALGPGWRASVDAWLAGGLVMEDLFDLIESVMGRRNIDDRFRYFCGAAWKRVKELQTRAQAMLADGNVRPESAEHDDATVSCGDDDEFDQELVEEVGEQLSERAQSLTVKWGDPVPLWVAGDPEGHRTVHKAQARCIQPSELIKLVALDDISGHREGSTVAEVCAYPEHIHFCTACCPDLASRYNGAEYVYRLHPSEDEPSGDFVYPYGRFLPILRERHLEDLSDPWGDPWADRGAF